MENRSKPRSLLLTEFEEEFNTLERHFRKDDKYYSFVLGKPPRGQLDGEIRVFNQILLPSSLDKIGIPKSGRELKKVCFQIVDLLWRESEEALKDWVKRHDEPIEFLGDYNDPRVIEISTIAQGKLNGR